MLIESLGQTPSQIEAVGHSLGAHLVGHLGRTVYDITGQKISRVTGNLMSMYVCTHLLQQILELRGVELNDFEQCGFLERFKEF